MRGGCLCGSIRYEAKGNPVQVVNCHCAMCRRHSGAAFLTYAAYRSDQVRFGTISPIAYRSSESAVRTHCARCGSPLTFVFDADPQTIWLTVGSMDEPDLVPPTEHWYTDDRVAWVRIDDDLAKRNDAPS